jgi:hypothetical protein
MVKRDIGRSYRFPYPVTQSSFYVPEHHQNTSDRKGAVDEPHGYESGFAGLPGLNHQFDESGAEKEYRYDGSDTKNIDGQKSGPLELLGQYVVKGFHADVGAFARDHTGPDKDRPEQDIARHFLGP